jgi:hypothetical protein
MEEASTDGGEEGYKVGSLAHESVLRQVPRSGGDVLQGPKNGVQTLSCTQGGMLGCGGS